MLPDITGTPLSRSYQKGRWGAGALAAGLLAGTMLGAAATGQKRAADIVFSCDPELARLFTPPRPVLGKYDACTTVLPLREVADPEWAIEQLAPADAFGEAGVYNRHALAQVYGGRRATVARGWMQRDGQFESVTLISPYPNAALTALTPGTLRIRHIICCL